jgi:hypothetical protein
MTWGRKTGGRKKGTPNKIKKPPALLAEAQAEVAAAVSANEGLQPLDYMLQVMRDSTVSEARRDMMAKAAAPMPASAAPNRPSGAPRALRCGRPRPAR